MQQLGTIVNGDTCTNRPASAVSRHVTEDIYMILCAASLKVHRVHAVRTFTAVEDVSTISRF